MIPQCFVQVRLCQHLLSLDAGRVCVVSVCSKCVHLSVLVKADEF